MTSNGSRTSLRVRLIYRGRGTRCFIYFALLFSRYGGGDGDGFFPFFFFLSLGFHYIYIYVYTGVLYTYRYTPTTTTTVRTMGTVPGLVSHSGHFKFERRANRVRGLTLLSAYSRRASLRRVSGISPVNLLMLSPLSYIAGRFI